MNNTASLSEIKSILLIEDDFDHAELTNRIINSNHREIKVIHVKTGEKAIDFLLSKCNSRKIPIPDIILLDLRLPGIEGVEVLKKLKSSDKTKQIPVIVLSTSGFNHDKEMAKKYMANHYLVKPLNYKDFIQALAELKIYKSIR